MFNLPTILSFVKPSIWMRRQRKRRMIQITASSLILILGVFLVISLRDTSTSQESIRDMCDKLILRSRLDLKNQSHTTTSQESIRDMAETLTQPSRLDPKTQPQTSTSQESPSAWRLRSQEDGLLRVMKYIEGEQGIDGLLRDAFVDRIWKSIQREMILYPVDKLTLRSKLYLKDKPHTSTSQKSPPAWRSKSQEVGLLRVMNYVEREREIDGVLRDAFVDRIWKSIKMDLIRDLSGKLILRTILDRENQQRRESSSGLELELNSLYEVMRENADLLDFQDSSVTDEKKNGDVFDLDPKIVNFSTRKVDFEKFMSFPILSPFVFSYRYNQSQACLTGSQHAPEIIIAVPSAPGNFKRRNYVRKSARAKFAQNPANRAKLLFFMGISDPSAENSSKEIQNRIDEEQQRYGDIVQSTFVDTYKNITKKAAQLFHWSTKYCLGGKFLIRIDDDTEVNMSNLVIEMKNFQSKYTNFILGGRIPKNWLPHRHMTSKYFMSYEDYPYKYLPRFSLGGVIGYPIKTAGLLLDAMRRIPLTWLDDVFVTGICAKKVNVPLFHNAAFEFKHLHLG